MLRPGGLGADNPTMKVRLQPPPEHLGSAAALFRIRINFFFPFSLSAFLMLLMWCSIFAQQGLLPSTTAMTKHQL